MAMNRMAVNAVKLVADIALRNRLAVNFLVTQIRSRQLAAR